MEERKGSNTYPLTSAQKLHYYSMKYCPKKQVLNIGTSLTIQVELQWDVLKDCIREAIQRCEALRVQFGEDKDGNVYQYVIEEEIPKNPGEIVYDTSRYLVTVTVSETIEGEQKIPETHKRLIKVAVYTQNSFLVIRIENYCESPVAFSSGLPVTTKADSQMHGYGVKSIQRAVEKYHGHLSLEQSDTWFTITALIPLPEQA